MLKHGRKEGINFQIVLVIIFDREVRSFFSLDNGSDLTLADTLNMHGSIERLMFKWAWSNEMCSTEDKQKGAVHDFRHLSKEVYQVAR